MLEIAVLEGPSECHCQKFFDLVPTQSSSHDGVIQKRIGLVDNHERDHYENRKFKFTLLTSKKLFQLMTLKLLIAFD